MAGPNDTTKFELFFLIFWILLTVALLALAVLRKLVLPNAIRGSSAMFSWVFAGLQFVTFVLILAALAYDGWSEFTSAGGGSLGVARVHEKGNQSRYARYDCSGMGGMDNKNACNTYVAAGAFTLIFGLLAIFVSLALLLACIASLAGRTTPLDPWVPVLANCQWILLMGCVIIWGVCFHDVQKQLGASSLELGPSWGLALTACIISIVTAFYFAGGAGSSGEFGGQPKESQGPPVGGPTTTTNNPTGVVQTV